MGLAFRDILIWLARSRLNGIHLSAAFMTLARSKAQGVEDAVQMLLRRTQEVEMNAQCCAGGSTSILARRSKRILLGRPCVGAET